MINKVTAYRLKKMGACSDAVNHFRKLFPKGIELNKNGARIYIKTIKQKGCIFDQTITNDRKSFNFDVGSDLCWYLEYLPEKYNPITLMKKFDNNFQWIDTPPMKQIDYFFKLLKKEGVIK